jgi:DUF971 family protein
MRALFVPLVVSFVVAGCVVKEPSPSGSQGSEGNINILWTFPDAGTCASLPQVTAVQVLIPGQEVVNQGTFPCSLDGTQGVELFDFEPATYNVTVSAVDSSNQALYSWSGTATVNGDVTVDAPLAPVTPVLAPGNVTFDWTFGDGGTCASVGASVTDIHIEVPGLTLPSGGYYPCETLGAQSEELPGFSGGSYTYTVDAVGADGGALFSASGSFEVNGNTTVDVSL